MLSEILRKEDCAKCRFCCSFRRQSLWETPLFTDEQKNSLSDKFPEAVFKKTGEKSWTVDLIHLYKTDDPEEEATCPFLSSNGCVCSKADKPFDCSIWPFRVFKNQDGINSVMLENTCPVVSKVAAVKIQQVLDNGLKEEILRQAEKNPDMIKEKLDGFKEF